MPSHVDILEEYISKFGRIISAIRKITHHEGHCEKNTGLGKDSNGIMLNEGQGTEMGPLMHCKLVSLP